MNSIAETANMPDDVRASIEKRARAADYLDTNPLSLTFDYLEKHDLPVFIRNNANVNALITFVVKSKVGGRSTPVEVPNTDIPLELTASHSFEDLRNSPDFMKSLANRTIKLIAPNAAAQIMSDPGVQRRMAKLNVSKFSKDSNDQPPKSFSLTPMINEHPVPGMPAQTTTPQVDPINNQLQVLVGDFKAGELSPEDFEDKVADSARTYKAVDWNWLKTQTDIPGVHQMADQQLSLLGAG